MPEKRATNESQAIAKRNTTHIVHCAGGTGTAAPAKRRAFLLLITFSCSTFFPRQRNTNTQMRGHIRPQTTPARLPPARWTMGNGKHMKKHKAARHRCNGHRAYMSITRDIDTIAQIERAEFWAGIIIAIAFGFCILLGVA